MFYSLTKIIISFENLALISDCENPVDCGTWTSANDISTEGEFVWRSPDSEGPINYSNWDVNPDDVILHDDLIGLCGHFLYGILEYQSMYGSKAIHLRKRQL